MSSQRPASEDQSSGEPVVADEFFMRMVPWQEMSPELYAARYSDQVYCFSYEHMRFRNPEIDRWAHRLGEILFDPNELERVRRQYLTTEEYRQVLREMAQCKREITRLEQGSVEADQGEDR